MGWDWAGFTAGYGAVLTAFLFAWVVGLAAACFREGGE